MNTVTRAWNNFFFKKTSPATIGLYRICFGVVIFLALLGRYPFRELFYTDNGIVSYATISHYFPDSWFYFRWLPAEDPWLNIYFLGLMAATLSLIAGFQTRISSILVFLGLMSLSNRNFFIDNAGDDLMRISCFFLMFTNAGGAYSIDRLRRIKKGLEGKDLTPCSPWAHRLLQLQVAYLYAETFLLKLPGQGWQDGTAIYYSLHYLELRRFDLRYAFYYLWQIKLATYGTLAGEFLLWTAVWVRRARYWVLATGIALHLGINLALQFPIFQYVMIASLVSFFYPEDVERAIEWFSGWTKNKTGRFNRPVGLSHSKERSTA